MDEKWIICGLNGCGKSTLAVHLSKKLDWRYLDIEDYWFQKPENGYQYAVSCTKDQVIEALLTDLQRPGACILASVTGDYGPAVEACFTKAIWLRAPKAVRMERVRQRSYEKFGEKILPGGDLYEQERRFFEMAASREEYKVTNWLARLSIPVVEVDATNAIEQILTDMMQTL